MNTIFPNYIIDADNIISNKIQGMKIFHSTVLQIIYID